MKMELTDAFVLTKLLMLMKDIEELKDFLNDENYKAKASMHLAGAQSKIYATLAEIMPAEVFKDPLFTGEK